jgi:hypothetical protein
MMRMQLMIAMIVAFSSGMFASRSDACVNCHGLDSCEAFSDAGFERRLESRSGGGCDCVAWVAGIDDVGAASAAGRTTACCAPGDARLCGPAALGLSPPQEELTGSTRDAGFMTTLSAGISVVAAAESPSATIHIDASALVQLNEVDKNAALTLEMLRRSATANTGLSLVGDLEGYVDGAMSKSDTARFIQGMAPTVQAKARTPIPLKYSLRREASSGAEVIYRLTVQGGSGSYRLVFDSIEGGVTPVFRLRTWTPE